jgi:hypothetical protein
MHAMNSILKFNTTTYLTSALLQNSFFFGILFVLTMLQFLRISREIQTHQPRKLTYLLTYSME